LIDAPQIAEKGRMFLLRTVWFPFIMTSQASFYAAMSFAGATYYSIKNLPPNTANLLSLRHKAITSINDRLLEPNICTDDQTIAGVFCISILESVYGDTSSYNIHMSGLEKMVQMRGGLESPGLRGLLARMAVWLDFNHAKLHGTPLHFGKSAEVGSRPSPFKHPRRAKSSSFYN
jgi:hypothetical protein